jgi:hypothetical protein
MLCKCIHPNGFAHPKDHINFMLHTKKFCSTNQNLVSVPLLFKRRPVLVLVFFSSKMGLISIPVRLEPILILILEYAVEKTN